MLLLSCPRSSQPGPPCLSLWGCSFLPEAAARGPEGSHRSRFDLSFPNHEVNSSCSSSPRCNRQPLESFIAEKPLDKEQSSVPRRKNSRSCEEISQHPLEAPSNLSLHTVGQCWHQSHRAFILQPKWLEPRNYFHPIISCSSKSSIVAKGKLCDFNPK